MQWQEIGLENCSGERTKKEQSKRCPCMQHSFLTLYMSLLQIIKTSQTEWGLLHAQYFCFRGDNYITKKVRVVSLARNKLTSPPFSPLPNFINICLRVSKLRSDKGSIYVFLLQGKYLLSKAKASCLSCTRYAYWSSSSSLLNIIKLYQTVWQLGPA